MNLFTGMILVLWRILDIGHHLSTIYMDIFNYLIYSTSQFLDSYGWKAYKSLEVY